MATLAAAALIAVPALAAWVIGQPLVFASLGPTVYLLVESPTTPRASPRNTLLAHGIAIALGWGSLALFRLTTTPPATQVGVTGPRVGAIVLAVAVTAGLIVALGVSHPPAAATALLVALGTFRTAGQLSAMVLGVVLLTVVGVLANRARGLPVRWSAPDGARGS